MDKVENISKYDLNKESFFDKKEKNNLLRILKAYKKVNPQEYKYINTLAEYRELLFKKDYNANEIDIFMLSKVLGINILVLEKRHRQGNPKGFYGYIFNLNNNFIMLFEKNLGDNKKEYSAIEKNGSYVFRKKDLPKIIKTHFKIKNEENIFSSNNL